MHDLEMTKKTTQRLGAHGRGTTQKKKKRRTGALVMPRKGKKRQAKFIHHGQIEKKKGGRLWIPDERKKETSMERWPWPFKWEKGGPALIDRPGSRKNKKVPPGKKRIGFKNCWQKGLPTKWQEQGEISARVGIQKNEMDTETPNGKEKNW